MVDRTAGAVARRQAARFARWALLTGDRLVVAGVMVLGIGAAFVLVALLGVATVTRGSRVMWYLNGTVNGLLTLVPITVGVNQIVLSHEFGSIRDLYDRRTDITEFRERVENKTGTTVTSNRASPFFQTLLSSIADAADAVERPPDGTGGSAADLDRTLDAVADEATRVNDALAARSSNMRQTFLIALTFDDSEHFQDLRLLASELSDSDPETADQVQHVIDLLTEVDAARQFLKTVVVERELARLSRLLVYTGIPAVGVAAIAIFSYRDVAGLTLPHVALVFVAATLLVATLVPLAILCAYVLRVATIARKTAAYGPFVPESD